LLHFIIICITNNWNSCRWSHSRLLKLCKVWIYKMYARLFCLIFELRMPAALTSPISHTSVKLKYQNAAYIQPVYVFLSGSYVCWLTVGDRYVVTSKGFTTCAVPRICVPREDTFTCSPGWEWFIIKKPLWSAERTDPSVSKPSLVYAKGSKEICTDIGYGRY
jgi:hypothetical protein